MTGREAQAVLRIMLTADGDCVVCGPKLVQSFIATFPQYEGLACEVWLEKGHTNPEGWRERF